MILQKPKPVPVFYKFRKKYENKGGDFKCPTCNGNTWIYDPNDPPCSYEGSKYRNRITCTKCEGSGIGEESYYKKLWNLSKVMYKDNLREYNKTKQLVEKLKSKLTKDDVNIIEFLSGIRNGIKDNLL